MAQVLPIKTEPSLSRQLVIPPIQTVCESYPIQEIPPTVPPPVFVGSFVYSIHPTGTQMAMHMHQQQVFQPVDPAWQAAHSQPRANSAAATPSPATTQKRKREVAPREQAQNTPDPAALAAFKNFVQDKQPQVVARYPELAEEDLQKFLSQMWQAAPEAEKKQYYANADSNLPTPKRKRVKKDPQAPKRNMSAFLFYSNDRRGEVKKANPNLTFSEIAKILSDMWHNAPLEDKTECLERARIDKHRYFKEKKAYDDHLKSLGIAPEETGSNSDNEEEMVEG